MEIPLTNLEIKAIARGEVAGLIEQALCDDQGLNNLKELYSLTDQEIKTLEGELRRIMKSLNK